MNHSRSCNQKVAKMKRPMLGIARYRTPMLAVIVTLGTLMLAQPSHAAACVNGVYRAGCVGPNGAVGVHKAYPHHHGYGYHHYGYGYHRPVSCAHGPYRAGCVGPHGGAVVRRPY
jgi:hypothetical protein